MAAPKQSPRPQARQEPYDMSGMDVEFRAALEPVLKNDPIARLGYAGDVNFLDQEGLSGAWHVPSNYPQAHSGLTEGNLGKPVNPDSVSYSADYGASPEVISHEMRHRGLGRVFDMYTKDPTAFAEKYGNDAAVYLEIIREDQDTNEAFTEVGDKPHEHKEWLDAAGVEQGTRALSDTISTDRAYLDDKQVNSAYTQIARAAQDALRESGEPPKTIPKEAEGWFKSLIKKVGFAEGGSVSKLSSEDFKEYLSGYSEGGMTMKYNQGGMADSGVEVEPTTGNEVPPGSLPEEVADNIDIKVSGGEYIFPADVAQFYGLKHLEAMRDKAKEKLGELDQGGRIGGKPVSQTAAPQEDELPFSDEELATEQGYAEGGLTGAQYQAPIGSRANLSFGGMGQTGGVESRIYKNTQGQTRRILFINGQPISQIPQGFYPEGQVPAQAAQATTASVSDESNRRQQGQDELQTDRKPFDPTKMTFEELNKQTKQNDMLAKLAKGAGLVGGLPGMLMGGIGNQVLARNNSRMIAEIQNRIDSGNLSEEEVNGYEKMMARISDDDGGLLGRAINDEDSWLNGILGGMGIDMGYGEDEIAEITSGSTAAPSAPSPTFSTSRTTPLQGATAGAGTFGAYGADGVGTPLSSYDGDSNDSNRYDTGQNDRDAAAANTQSYGGTGGTSYDDAVQQTGSTGSYGGFDPGGTGYSAGQDADYGYAGGGLVKRRKKKK